MRVTLCALLLVLAAAGCGTADDREQARGAVLRFNHALEERRGSAACAELSAAAVAALESRSGRGCARAVTALELSGWKIGAVGCRPEEGKPRDRPLDCEVEA